MLQGSLFVRELNRSHLALCYNTRVANGRDRSTVAGIALLVIALTTLPYLYAQFAVGSQHQFTGFLLNPIDGQSYLAKMMQGRAGHWRFTLPYTAEPGPGAYLFLFYLALGRISGILNFPNILTFHLVRVLATALMLAALFKFYRFNLPEGAPYRLAFALSALGSGLGWMTIPFGGFTSDFWVAEAYPFLSAYSNPHFPLGLALLLWILTPLEHTRLRIIRMFLLGLLLALILPFGLAAAGAILVLQTARWLWWELPGSEAVTDRQRSVAAMLGHSGVPDSVLQPLAALGGGAIVLLYDWWIVRIDPNLRIWNSQNLTPAPDPVDLIISFFPALPLAALATARLIQKRIDRAFVLNAWLLITPLLVYLPFNLQRRLLVGYFVPAAGLAVTGIWMLTRQRRSLQGPLYIALVVLSLPTNLLILFSAGFGVQTRDPLLFLDRSEAAALEWISRHTDPADLILASPEMGLFIPAYSGRRVLYGHPFETVYAEAEERALREFFVSGTAADLERLSIDRGVRYLFWGPRERAIAGQFSPVGLIAVYRAGSVSVFRAPDD